MPRLRPGKPKKFRLDSLFLPDLDLLMAMDGGSLSGIARENRFGSLLRKIDVLGLRTAALNEVWDLSDGSRRRYKSIRTDLTTLGAFNLLENLDEKVQAAMNGDQGARAELDKMSAWQALAKHLGDSDWWGASVTHCAEVERASDVAVRLLRANDNRALALEISTNSKISPYFPELAVAMLIMANSEADVLMVRAVGLCEFLLSQIALLDIKLQKQDDDLFDGSLLPALLQVGADGRVNPGRNFFQCFRTEVGAKSLLHLENMAGQAKRKPAGAIAGESTLKNWNSGRSFPAARMVRTLLEAVLQSVTSSELRQQIQRRVAGHYLLARRIDTLQDLLATLLPLTAPGQVGLMDVLGAASVDDWIVRGSGRWLTHWSESTGRSN